MEVRPGSSTIHREWRAAHHGRTTMKLWIANLAPGTTDGEIEELMKKYGPELQCTGIERVDGDGSRPGAILEFTGSSVALGKLNLRLSGLYWKGRALVSSVSITT
jgi:hypothetical protein